LRRSASQATAFAAIRAAFLPEGSQRHIDPSPKNTPPKAGYKFTGVQNGCNFNRELRTGHSEAQQDSMAQ
jgi:hypothetical protein